MGKVKGSFSSISGLMASMLVLVWTGEPCAEGSVSAGVDTACAGQGSGLAVTQLLFQG